MIIIRILIGLIFSQDKIYMMSGFTKCTNNKLYSDEWEWIVDNLFHAKCDEVGYCTETKSCGRKHKKGGD